MKVFKQSMFIPLLNSSQHLFSFQYPPYLDQTKRPFSNLLHHPHKLSSGSIWTCDCLRWQMKFCVTFRFCPVFEVSWWLVRWGRKGPYYFSEEQTRYSTETLAWWIWWIGWLSYILQYILLNTVFRTSPGSTVIPLKQV